MISALELSVLVFLETRNTKHQSLVINNMETLAYTGRIGIKISKLKTPVKIYKSLVWGWIKQLIAVCSGESGLILINKTLNLHSEHLFYLIVSQNFPHVIARSSSFCYPIVQLDGFSVS